MNIESTIYRTRGEHDRFDRIEYFIMNLLVNLTMDDSECRVWRISRSLHLKTCLSLRKVIATVVTFFSHFSINFIYKCHCSRS